MNMFVSNRVTRVNKQTNKHISQEKKKAQKISYKIHPIKNVYFAQGDLLP